MADSKTLLENEDAGATEVRARFEELQAALHKVSEELYKSSAPDDAGGDEATSGSGAGEGGGEDVVDAEFTEEK